MAQTGPRLDRSFSRKLIFGRGLQRQRSDKWFFRTLPFPVTASLSRSGTEIPACHQKVARFKKLLVSCSPSSPEGGRARRFPLRQAREPGCRREQASSTACRHRAPLAPQRTSCEVPRSLRKDEGGLDQLISRSSSESKLGNGFACCYPSARRRGQRREGGTEQQRNTRGWGTAFIES